MSTYTYCVIFYIHYIHYRIGGLIVGNSCIVEFVGLTTLEYLMFTEKPVIVSMFDHSCMLCTIVILLTIGL